MKIVEIELNSCFNITRTPGIPERFSPDDGPSFDPGLFEQIIYRCQECNFEISFYDRDFKKHSHLDFTNLTDPDREIFESYLSQNKYKVNSFLDFCCPSCKTPTRIFYSDGDGGKCGDYQVMIDFGLTIRK